MKLADIQMIYEYSRWATRRILAAAAQLDDVQYAAPVVPDPGLGSLRGTLVHMLDTEHGWRTICQHARFAPDITEADLPTLDALRQHWDEEEAAWREYLAGLSDADLSGVVRYTNSEGEPRARLLWHLLWHVVNHGTQHRSEAAAMLTGYGASPGDLDFTQFLAETKWSPAE